MKFVSVTIQVKATEQYIPVVLFIMLYKVTLKGPRHEDFAVLVQFCAKIVTWCFYSYTKCSCKTTNTI